MKPLTDHIDRLLVFRVAFFEKIDVFHNNFRLRTVFCLFFLGLLVQRRRVGILNRMLDVFGLSWVEIGLLILEEVDDWLVGGFLCFVGQWYFFRLVLPFRLYLVYKLCEDVVLRLYWRATFFFGKFLQIHLDKMLEIVFIEDTLVWRCSFFYFT